MSQIVRTPSSLLRLPAPITTVADRDRRSIRYPMISDLTGGVMSAGISGGGDRGGSRAISSCGVARVGNIGGPVMTRAASQELAAISPRASRLRGKSGNQNVTFTDEDNAKTMQVDEVPAVESGSEHVNDVSDDTTILQVDQVLVAETGNQALNPIYDHTTTVQVNKALPAQFDHQDLVPISGNTTIVQADTVLGIEPGNQALNPVSDDTTTIQVNKVLVAQFEHQDMVPISGNTTTVQPDGVLQTEPAVDGNKLEEECDNGEIELLHERIHKKGYTVETLMRIKPRKPMPAKQMAKIGWDVLHEMEKLKGIPKEEVEPQNALVYFEVAFSLTTLSVATALVKATTLPPKYVLFLLGFCALNKAALNKAKEHLRTLVYSKLNRIGLRNISEQWSFPSSKELE